MKLSRPLFIVLLLAVFCWKVSAQTMPVLVDHTGDDVVGQRLAYLVKDEVRRSGSFNLVYDETDAIYQVHLITLDPDEGYPQGWTIYSASFVLSNEYGFDDYLTSKVGYCGSAKLQGCAENIVQEVGIWNENFLETLSQSVSQNPFE